jgi:hypothetical protein
VHAVGLALELDGPDAARRYGEAFLAAGAMGSYARTTRHILDLLDPETRAAAITRIVDSLPPQQTQVVIVSIHRWVDSAETLLRLFRTAAAREQARGQPGPFSVNALPLALAGRGHLREAAALGSPKPLLLVQLMILGTVPVDSVARIAAGWTTQPGQGAMLAAPVFAARRDTASLVAFIQRMDRIRSGPLPPEAPPIAREVLAYLAAASRAYLMLARGDSAAALQAFDALPDSACFGGCAIDQLVHIQLLAARGRVADAAALIERPQLGAWVADVLRALERGRVNERLGNRERAIAGYEFVLEAWRNADPELKPYVDEARAALARLGGEKRPS